MIFMAGLQVTSTTVLESPPDRNEVRRGGYVGLRTRRRQGRSEGGLRVIFMAGLQVSRREERKGGGACGEASLTTA